MFLFSEEERVADNIMLKVTREEEFDLTSSLDLRGAKVGQAAPGTEWAVSDEVGVFVDTSAFFFLVGILLLCSCVFITFFFRRLITAFCRGLHDVVVSLGATDLAKEANEGACL